MKRREKPWWGTSTNSLYYTHTHTRWLVSGVEIRNVYSTCLSVLSALASIPSLLMASNSMMFVILASKLYRGTPRARRLDSLSWCVCVVLHTSRGIFFIPLYTTTARSHQIGALNTWGYGRQVSWHIRAVLQLQGIASSRFLSLSLFFILYVENNKNETLFHVVEPKQTRNCDLLRSVGLSMDGRREETKQNKTKKITTTRRLACVQEAERVCS